MKCLARNKQSFYYALYSGKTAEVDEFSNETGEYRVSYEEPVICEGNISVAKGEVQTEIFGINAEYDRVIVLDDVSCPITEESILFIGVTPTQTDGNYNNNYIVKRVAKSLNSISLAISEVGSDENQS